jgi:integrase
MAVLAISVGLRRGELLGLRWCDVDLLTGIVRIRRHIVRGEVATPKTEHSRRTLELGPEARAAIEEQFAASAFTADDDYVFPNPMVGTAMDGAKLGRCYMRPALAKAGIRADFRPWHDLRRTALTFSAAVNPGYVVKAQAGHGSMAVTDRYVKLAMPLVLGAARAERLLFADLPAARSVQVTVQEDLTESRTDEAESR